MIYLLTFVVFNSSWESLPHGYVIYVVKGCKPILDAECLWTIRVHCRTNAYSVLKSHPKDRDFHTYRREETVATQYFNVLILSKIKDSSWVPSVFKTYALPLGCRGDGSGTFIKHNFTQKYISYAIILLTPLFFTRSWF